MTTVKATPIVPDAADGQPLGPRPIEGGRARLAVPLPARPADSTDSGLLHAVDLPADLPGNSSMSTAATITPKRPRTIVSIRRKRPIGRWFKPLAGAVVVVGLPIAAVAWLLSSPRFALAHLEVAGTDRVAAGWVSAALAPLNGRNLWSLPLVAVEERLASHPWIAGVEATKQLPDRLLVQVIERQAAMVVEFEGERWFADRDGAPIDRVDRPAAADGAASAVEPDALLAVRWVVPVRQELGRGARSLAVGWGGAPEQQAGRRAVAQALTAIEELEAAAPGLAAAVSGVEVFGDEEFRLLGERLPFEILVRAGRVQVGVETLAKARTELASIADAEVVDLRYHGRVVVRRAVAGSSDGRNEHSRN